MAVWAFEMLTVIHRAILISRLGGSGTWSVNPAARLLPNDVCKCPVFDCWSSGRFLKIFSTSNFDAGSYTLSVVSMAIAVPASSLSSVSS